MERENAKECGAITMELKWILEQFQSLTHVPVRLYDGGTARLSYGAEIFSDGYDRDVIGQFLASGETYCYQVTPEALLYGFLRLDKADHCLVLGPVCREPDLHLTVSRLASAFHCEVKKELWEYCGRLSVSSLHSFLAHIQTLYTILHREQYCGKRTVTHLYSSHVPHSESLQAEIEQLYNHTIEQRILTCIEYGKEEDLRHVLKFQLKATEMPEYVDTSLLRAFQNVFIASVALCSRAAIRGGMDYDAAIHASDQYISRTERMRSAAQIERELVSMMLWYAGQVAVIRGFSQASPLVRNTVAYIQAHLTEKITVNDIAEAFGQNPSYLSHHFKEQTGESISSYIVSEKINEAKRLLRCSELSLLDLSAQLGFSSQQYFQSVFKKQVGCTPTEYRKQDKG